jgi:ElaB/YqjD/DUF883 family membrane-anchored ribosome-binding protein
MEATRRSNHSDKGTHADIAASVAPVVERIADGAHDAVDKAAGAATAAVRMVDQKSGKLLKTVQERQARYVEGSRERVREHPLASLGVALAAGIVLGFLLIRR